MARNFKELQAKMSPARRARVEARVHAVTRSAKREGIPHKDSAKEKAAK
jgi:hypothetical protein